MEVYVRYSSKKPHLPIAVADSMKELAQMLGIKYESVQKSYTMRRKWWEVVEIGDE
jgi:hypothetical protein